MLQSEGFCFQAGPVNGVLIELAGMERTSPDQEESSMGMS